MRHRVFVSYSSTDKKDVRNFVDALSIQGFDVRWDEDFDTTQSIDENISEEINRAHSIVLFVGKPRENSDWISGEIETARDQKKRIYSVILPGGKKEDRPTPMRGYPAIEGDSLQDLIEKLADKLGNGLTSTARMLELEKQIEELREDLRGRGNQRKRLLIGICLAILLSIATPIGSFSGLLRGDPGPPGDQGLQGREGENGDEGERGKDGREGKEGPTGALGLKGPIGDKGDRGEPGRDGAFVLRGAWREGASYEKLEVVEFDKEYYVCLNRQVSMAAEKPGEGYGWLKLAIGVKPGTIVLFCGDEPPPGWMRYDGIKIDQQTNPRLC